MNPYLRSIRWSRRLVLTLSFLFAATILLGYDYYPVLLPPSYEAWLWKLNSLAIFVVMILRPLSDLLPQQRWLRALVPTRKELGILSALIVLSFGLAKYHFWGWNEFVTTYFSLAYWPFPEPVFWGRLGELVAVPLLLTSNNWSVRLLKRNWKRIQRLAYVYFYAGAYYVYVAFGATEELWFMVIVAVLVLAAWGKKKWKWY